MVTSASALRTINAVTKSQNTRITGENSLIREKTEPASMVLNGRKLEGVRHNTRL